MPLELVYLRAFATVREFGQERARYLRAEPLMAFHRYDEALMLSDVVPGLAGGAGVPGAGSPARGGDFEARGEREKAATHYRRVIALWGNSDAPLASVVRDARDRLPGFGDAR